VKGKSPHPNEPSDASQPGPDEAAATARDPDAGEDAPAAQEPAGAAPDAAAGEESPAVLRDRWLRAEADLQNYRRRARRDADEGRRIAEERVMLEIVHALDDLDRAAESAAQAGAPESWTAGVTLTSQRLREYLSREGVRTLDPAGQPFDPAFHEAILEVDAPAGVEPGHVVQVVLKGYARGDRSLRPARVVVARVARTTKDG
jgi:molecular chaperone GrpE